VKLTADTITDEQIRALHDAQPGGASEDLHETCRIALYVTRDYSRRMQARARCAELLNARSPQ
jgi:hypothetical protein